MLGLLRTELQRWVRLHGRHPIFLRSIYATLAASVLPYLFLIKFPFSAYVSNQYDIVFYNADAQRYLLTFALSTIILALPAWFIKKKFINLYFQIAIIFIIIKSIYDSIYSNVWVESHYLIAGLLVIELSLIAIIIFIIRKLDSEKLTRAAFITYLALLPIDIYHFGAPIYELPIGPTNALENMTSDATGGKGKNNVYHLILDGFSPYIMRKEILNTDIEKQLPGFVFYTNAKANYGRTHLSIPSMMSGTLHDHYNGLNFQEWAKKAMNDGIANRLAEAEIPQVWFTFLEHFYKRTACKNPYIYCDHTQGRYRSVDESKISDTSLPFDLAFFTYLPASVRYMIWLRRGGSGRPDEITEMPFKSSNFFGGSTAHLAISNNEVWSPDRHIQSYTYNSFLDFLAWDTNNAKDGQYAYIHLLHPHGPYTRDEDCNLEDQVNNYHGISIHHQCSFKIIEQFLTHLKKLNRYDNSTIIINSDHGCVTQDVLTDAKTWDRQFNAEAKLNRDLRLTGWVPKNDGNVRDRKANQIEIRAGSLLLVKPAGAARNDMETSFFNAQLLDIYPTILESYGLSTSDRLGISLLSTPDHSNTHPREQIFVAANNNSPRRVKELQRFKRTDAGWVLYGEKLLVNEGL